jgi:hypothetical protein
MSGANRATGRHELMVLCDERGGTVSSMWEGFYSCALFSMRRWLPACYSVRWLRLMATLTITAVGIVAALAGTAVMVIIQAITGVGIVGTWVGGRLRCLVLRLARQWRRLITTRRLRASVGQGIAGILADRVTAAIRRTDGYSVGNWISMPKQRRRWWQRRAAAWRSRCRCAPSRRTAGTSVVA